MGCQFESHMSKLMVVFFFLSKKLLPTHYFVNQNVNNSLAFKATIAVIKPWKHECMGHAQLSANGYGLSLTTPRVLFEIVTPMQRVYRFTVTGHQGHNFCNADKVHVQNLFLYLKESHSFFDRCEGAVSACNVICEGSIDILLRDTKVTTSAMQ